MSTFSEARQLVADKTGWPTLGYGYEGPGHFLVLTDPPPEEVVYNDTVTVVDKDSGRVLSVPYDAESMDSWQLVDDMIVAAGNPAQLRVPKGNEAGGQWVDSVTGVLDDLDPDRRTAKRLGGKGEPTTYAALGADPVALQKNVNPGGYKQNCQRVGMAVEMQARGFPNAVAPDNERTDPTNITKLEQMWKPDPTTGRQRQFEIALDGDPNSLIADDPVGARYLISGRGKRGGGHVWNAEKGPDGKLVQIDGQIGEEAHPERMDFGQSLLRVDDLDPSFAALAGSTETGEGPWVVSRAKLKEQVGA